MNKTSPNTMFDNLNLTDARNAMTNMELHSSIVDAVHALLDDWRTNPETATPLADLRAVIENIRSCLRSDMRVRKMNSLVRTLGEPGNLADYLDALRNAARRDGSQEQSLSKMSSDGTMHCIYGWCGQTTMMDSTATPTPGTGEYDPVLSERLGYPTVTWGMSMHIWQPNPNAKGFVLKSGAHNEAVFEPPHSHPFDFVSMVSAGSLKQSIYQEIAMDEDEEIACDRYAGTSLEKIDGIWPPHNQHEAVHVKTIENQLQFAVGDSYFMPSSVIHDVEIDVAASTSNPAITLFFASEAKTISHAYVLPDLISYHTDHPDLRKNAKPLTQWAWDKKLSQVASYLRGTSATLNLDETIKYDGEYAFFNRETADK